MSPNRTKTRKRPGRKPQNVDLDQLALARSEVTLTHKRLRTWDAVRDHYGLSKAALYRISKDGGYKPSQQTIDHVLRVGVAPMPPVYQLPPCPDCGNPPHTGRCNGKAVAEVVTLAPGETVKRNGKPRRRKRYDRPCLPPGTMQALAAAGLDLRQIIAAALNAAQGEHDGTQGIHD